MRACTVPKQRAVSLVHPYHRSPPSASTSSLMPKSRISLRRRAPAKLSAFQRLWGEAGRAGGAAGKASRSTRSPQPRTAACTKRAVGSGRAKGKERLKRSRVRSSSTAAPSTAPQTPPETPPGP